jgi:hypothetical protein
VQLTEDFSAVSFTGLTMIPRAQVKTSVTLSLLRRLEGSTEPTISSTKMESSALVSRFQEMILLSAREPLYLNLTLNENLDLK